MVIANDPGRRWDFTVSAELLNKPQTSEPAVQPEDRTVFHLRALTPAQVAEVTDMGMVFDRARGTSSNRIGAVTLRIIQYGLVGWTNLRNAHGEQVPFPEDVNERIALLPEEVRAEIASEVRFNAEVTVDEGN